jgi:hypothetical protein
LQLPEFLIFLQNLTFFLGSCGVRFELLEFFHRNPAFFETPLVDTNDPAFCLYLAVLVWDLVVFPQIVLVPVLTDDKVMVLALLAIVPGFSMFLCCFELWVL